MPTPVEKDACDLLDADHIAVKHLFVDYARLANGSPPGGLDGDKLSLARKICNELTVHATIEEEIFYPALREATDAEALLDEAEAEHQEAKELIAQIEAAQSADAKLDELVATLAGAIEHHVKEERDHLFTKARSAPGLDLFALATQLKERQQELEGQMA
jgi:hypothetical protein